MLSAAEPYEAEDPISPAKDRQDLVSEVPQNHPKQSLCYAIEKWMGSSIVAALIQGQPP